MLTRGAHSSMPPAASTYSASSRMVVHGQVLDVAGGNWSGVAWPLDKATRRPQFLPRYNQCGDDSDEGTDDATEDPTTSASEALEEEADAERASSSRVVIAPTPLFYAHPHHHYPHQYGGGRASSSSTAPASEALPPLSSPTQQLHLHHSMPPRQWPNTQSSSNTSSSLAIPSQEQHRQQHQHHHQHHQHPMQPIQPLGKPLSQSPTSPSPSAQPSFSGTNGSRATGQAHHTNNGDQERESPGAHLKSDVTPEIPQESRGSRFWA
mmetsp:Transcript_68002/g.142003  ORF Transcript_68002/g.142003 Transcript_68002/m.142003 type:complete len:265 (+) Transcript_68002:35-829(+)